MLKHSQRLTTALFDEVIKKGRVQHSPLFVLRYMPQQGPLRVSVAVAKKVSKLATGRVSIRRRVYAALRKVISAKNYPAGYYIVSAKTNLADISHSELYNQLVDLMNKA